MSIAQSMQITMSVELADSIYSYLYVNCSIYLLLCLWDVLIIYVYENLYVYGICSVYILSCLWEFLSLCIIQCLWNLLILYIHISMEFAQSTYYYVCGLCTQVPFWDVC